MNGRLLGSLAVTVKIEQWPLLAPFRTAVQIIKEVDVIAVSLETEGHIGRGEAAGVYYRGESVGTMARQIESIRTVLGAGLTRGALQKIIPPGGARNALDCALWDLEAKLNGQPVWAMAGLRRPQPLQTLLTCGADEPLRMAATARSYIGAGAIKLKLTGDDIDADRIVAVREARSDVRLSVDANQAFTLRTFEKLLPVLVEANVSLVEQPFRVGQEALLDGLMSPIPIAADESVQSHLDIPALVGRFDVVNIKLDKCGGLTEGLAMAVAARELGFGTYVGNMFGTSLAMAPAFLLAQICDFVELDGPLFLESDRENPVSYIDGVIKCPDALWGQPGENH